MYKVILYKIILFSLYTFYVARIIQQFYIRKNRESIKIIWTVHLRNQFNKTWIELKHGSNHEKNQSLYVASPCCSHSKNWSLIKRESSLSIRCAFYIAFQCCQFLQVWSRIYPFYHPRIIDGKRWPVASW